MEGSAGATGNFSNHQVVYIKPDADFYEMLDTVVHESTHVFQHIMEWVGEEAPGKETEAYSIGQISSTLFKELITQLGPKYAVHEERPKDGKVSS